jgi:tetratricopeptide (TPR) repeat protein
MSIEKTVDLHEAKIDKLAHSLKNLEKHSAMMYENLKFIKEQLQSLQQAIKNINDAQNNQAYDIKRIGQLSEKLKELAEFKDEIERSLAIEQAKKEQIKGAAKFLKSYWGLILVIFTGIGILYGAIDTAYKMPSPQQETKMIDLLKDISSKLH